MNTKSQAAENHAHEAFGEVWKGESSLAKDKRRQARKHFRHAGALWERAGDESEPIAAAIVAYKEAAQMHNLAERRLRARRAYRKELAEYTTLLRNANASEHNYPGMTDEFTSSILLLAATLERYSTRRIAVEKVRDILRRIDQFMGNFELEKDIKL